MKKLFLVLLLFALPAQAEVVFPPSIPFGSGGGALSNLGISLTANNPQISGDATSGFYTAGAGKVDVAIGGVKMGEWTASGYYAPLAITTGSGQYIGFYARSNILSPADGVFTLDNNATTGFTRLNFGGTTSSFPALQVNGTGLNAELADGSGLTSFNASLLNIGTPSITDTGVALQATGSNTGYFQTIMQNTSNGTGASTDYIVNNNLGTSSTYFGDFGINSSTYTGSGSFALPSATYLGSNSGDLAIGTFTSNAIHFVVNNGATDAMTISTAGVTTLGSPLPIASGGTAGNGTTNAQTGTSYTTVLGDAGNLITMNNASASTLTIPPNSSVAYPPDTIIHFVQLGAGAVTLTAGTGVTFVANNACSAPTAPVSIYGAQLGAELTSTANTWVILGICQ